MFNNNVSAFDKIHYEVGQGHSAAEELIHPVTVRSLRFHRATLSNVCVAGKYDMIHEQLLALSFFIRSSTQHFNYNELICEFYLQTLFQFD